MMLQMLWQCWKMEERKCRWCKLKRCKNINTGYSQHSAWLIYVIRLASLAGILSLFPYTRDKTGRKSAKKKKKNHKEIYFVSCAWENIWQNSDQKEREVITASKIWAARCNFMSAKQCINLSTCSLCVTDVWVPMDWHRCACLAQQKTFSNLDSTNKSLFPLSNSCKIKRELCGCCSTQSMEFKYRLTSLASSALL